jgi:PAS domain S-box-containing protein
MGVDRRSEQPASNEAAGDLETLRARVQELERAVADHEQLTATLRQQAGELHDLYNRAPCGYHSLDENGVFVRVNNTELTWLGYDRDELIGKKRFAEITTEAGMQIFRTRFPEFLARGVINNLEFELIRKDGSILPVLLSSTAVKDEAGNFLMSRSTLFDLTQRKQLERVTALRAVFDAIPDAVLHVRADGAIITVKTAPGMESLVPGAACVDKRVHDVLPARFADDVMAGVAEVLATRGLQSVEHELVEGGSARVYEARIMAHRREALIVVRDVTERRFTEEARTRSMVQEEIIRAQSLALAELSSPLLTIADRVVVMPLIGAVDERRSQQILEALLDGISANRASVAILDITGLSTVDSQVADALLRAARGQPPRRQGGADGRAAGGGADIHEPGDGSRDDRHT